jgi:hypothetical protein
MERAIQGYEELIDATIQNRVHSRERRL